jgi:hypothetical protein
MQHSEARAWWADVEHVRETIERRRAAERHLRVVPDRPAAAPSAGADTEEPATRGLAPAEAGRRSTASAGTRATGKRRTIEITGRTVPAPAVPRIGDPLAPVLGARGASRRPSLSPAERIASRPDRIALWAAILGFVLIVVAATSS